MVVTGSYLYGFVLICVDGAVDRKIMTGWIRSCLPGETSTP